VTEIVMGDLVIWRKDSDTYLVVIHPTTRDPRARIYRRDGTILHKHWVMPCALARIGRRRKLKQTEINTNKE